MAVRFDPGEVARLVGVMGISSGPPVTKETPLKEVLVQFLHFASQECCGECAVGHMGTAALSSLLEKEELSPKDRELLQMLSRLLCTSAKCGAGRVAGKIVDLMLELNLN